MGTGQRANGGQADPATGAELDAIPIVGASADAEDTEPALLRRWTMAELAAESDDFVWLVKRLLAEPTYGPIAGEMKTLKSYILGFLSVGVASGLPIFDTFTPQWRGRSWSMWAKVADSCGTAVSAGLVRRWAPRPRTLPSPGVRRGPDIESDISGIASARPGRDTARPRGLDPLYTYHGTAARASDLHQEGTLLNQLSGP